MSVLAQINAALDTYARFVEQQAARARKNRRFRAQLLQRWEEAGADVRQVTTPTGLRLPRLALPVTTEPGEIARYLYAEGLPGEFPFANGVYREMYLEKSGDRNPSSAIEDPTRLFAGFGLAEDTNRRFHYLTRQQKSIRLSTAFDGPTLYGLDSDAEGVFGKIGEGGVAIDTIEDMDRLYAGFPLGDEHFSVSMTINGPAPILLAMYIAAAKRRCGAGVVAKLRGPAQADVLKEVQAQNEMLFPVEPALRFLGDMVQYAVER